MKGGLQMKRRLLAVATGATALILPASAGARIAQANQFEGSLIANTCGAVRHVNVNGPARIDALFAGTNVGGLLVPQILDSSGTVLSETGSYTTPAGGTYGVRACYENAEGIDSGTVDYVGMVDTAAR
jgi:hypothetical protein